MVSEEDKGKIELEVFRRFVKNVGLGVREDSIRKIMAHSMPDIVCELDGEPVYFELTETVMPEFAEARVRAPAHGPLHSIDGEDISDAIVRNKLSKRYGVDGPIELLIYNHGRNDEPDESIMEKVQAELQDGLGPFRRVWYCGRRRVAMLGSKKDAV